MVAVVANVLDANCNRHGWKFGQCKWANCFEWSQLSKHILIEQGEETKEPITDNWDLNEIHANYQNKVLVYFASKEWCDEMLSWRIDI